MSVHKRADRPDRPWQVRWREEGRNRSRSFSRRRDAEDFDVDNRRRLEVGWIGPDPSRLTLDDWLEQWFATHGPAWEDSTVEQRARACDRHVSPHVGAVRLGELSRSRLREWRRDLLIAGASANTVNAVSRVLSAALTAAADDGLIVANPLLGMRALPKAPSERIPVPLRVVKDLLAAAPTDRDRRIVALMAYAGLRPGEVRVLRWSDVGERTIWVGRAMGLNRVKSTKSAKAGRSVPLREEAGIVKGEQTGVLVCPGDRGGVLNWRNWCRRVWRPACDALGVEHVPYSLRHTYASLRIAEGATVVEVAAEMGHASPVTTLAHYARLLDAAPRTS